MVKKRTLSGESTITDLNQAVKKSIFKCRDEFGTEEEVKACIQGVSYFKTSARRKFEGIFSTVGEVNRAYLPAMRLCFMRFNRRGINLVDACEHGAWEAAMYIKDKVAL